MKCTFFFQVRDFKEHAHFQAFQSQKASIIQPPSNLSSYSWLLSQLITSKIPLFLLDSYPFHLPRLAWKINQYLENETDVAA